MVLVNFSSPDRTALGAVNGISTAVGVSICVAFFSIALIPLFLVYGQSRWSILCQRSGCNSF